MPIERKDRSFDIIFDQVSLDHVPAEYILEINIDIFSQDLAALEQKMRNVRQFVGVHFKFKVCGESFQVFRGVQGVMFGVRLCAGSILGRWGGHSGV